MGYKHLLLTVGIPALCATLTAATLKDSLSDAIILEGKREIPAAIQTYKEIVTQHTEDRQAAGAAILRLIEVYQRQGKTDEAEAWKSRLAKEFPDIATQNDVRPARGSNAPYYSDSQKRIDDIERLLRESPDLINSRKNGSTLLHTAASQSDLPVAEYLLNHGAEVDVLDSAHQTPLMTAVTEGHKTMAEFLIRKGADVNFRARGSDQSETLLGRAARRGFTQVAESLLKAGAEVNATFHAGPGGQATALHNAVVQNSIPMVDLLVKHGAEVNPKGSTMVPLKAASPEMARRLIALGADPNHAGSDHEPPLAAAINTVGVHQTALILLEAGANPKFAYPDGTSLMHKAASAENVAVIAALAKHGADLNQRRKDGATPLHIAASRNSAVTVAALLKHGADVNARDNEKHNALHYIWRRDDTGMFGGQPMLTTQVDLEMLRTLVDAGIELNARTTNGLTPLELARISGTILVQSRYGTVDRKAEAVEFLRSKGAKYLSELDASEGEKKEASAK